MTDNRLCAALALLDSRQLDEPDKLAEPISEAAPCGPPIRFDPVYSVIRLAREADDPNLPMGVWERPLKRADWARVEELCKMALTRHAKDLQIAAWLTEAWTRQQGSDGLFRGLVLVERLLARFWDSVHPQLDDDGAPDGRVAPLEWINSSLSMTTRLSVPLLCRGAEPVIRLTLADWERMTTRELFPARHKAAAGDEASSLPLRADVIDLAKAELGIEVERGLRVMQGCLAALRSIEASSASRLVAEAPDMSQLRDTLHAIERVLLQMAPDEREAISLQDAHALAGTAAETPPRALESAGAVEKVTRLNQWSNRDQAYATLEAIAAYLGRVEPHSPTPYLLRRAVGWGRMSLPELMADISRAEGDLNRLARLRGLDD